MRERYRDDYSREFARWNALRTEPGAGGSQVVAVADAPTGELRSDAEHLAAAIGRHEAELNRLELAQRAMEHAVRFLEGDDGTPVAAGVHDPQAAGVSLRIVEAQEHERSRLAQEIHDGPAQALANAIFQVEYVERVIDHDTQLARSELTLLRQLLRRELGDVRTFISQLRPRVLDQLGLDGAIRETVADVAARTGLRMEVDLATPGSRLSEAQQTVVLRIVQEALQNVRKHAAASQAAVSSCVDGSAWILEIRDDGRGFDADDVTARGRRNFGLQFMRERAELIGARFEVRSRPDDGTVVRLAIPLQEESR